MELFFLSFEKLGAYLFKDTKLLYYFNLCFFLQVWFHKNLQNKLPTLHQSSTALHQSSTHSSFNQVSFLLLFHSLRTIDWFIVFDKFFEGPMLNLAFVMHLTDTRVSMSYCFFQPVVARVGFVVPVKELFKWIEGQRRSFINLVGLKKAIFFIWLVYNRST